MNFFRRVQSTWRSRCRCSGALLFHGGGDYNYIIGGKDVASRGTPPPGNVSGVAHVYFGHDDCHDLTKSISASSAFTLTNNGYVTVDFSIVSGMT
jgi:hypothetical protein